MDTKLLLQDSFLALVKNLTGKYAKSMLAKLEEAGLLTREIRKIILDSMNDLYREVEQKSLGG